MTFDLAIFLSFVLSRSIYPVLEKIVLRFSDADQGVNVMAVASIGGHWVQLLRLMPLFEKCDVTFISTKSELTKTIPGEKFYQVPDANRSNKIKLLISCLSMFRLILITRPKVIITTGAAPGLFGIVFGRLMGIKTVWIDSIANVEKLSLSGKIALEIADKVYTQWQHLATPEVTYAGNILE